MVIVFFGIASAFMVLPPHKVIRADGTIVKLNDQSSISGELKGLWEHLKDWRILGTPLLLLHYPNQLMRDLALFPMFFSVNTLYPYQGAVTAAVFDGPTRAVIAVLASVASIVGALLIGFFILDANWFRRKTRGWLGLAFVSITTIIVWSCGLSWQLTFTRETIGRKVSYKDNGFYGKGVLFFFCKFPPPAN